MDDLLKDLDIVLLMKFGSHLYGTETEASDTDYKGIFMPSKEQIFLGKIPKSITRNTKTSNEGKNSSEDVDIELYSLHYFIELACKGETAALDMLHVNKKNLLRDSEIWREIVGNRRLFLTKNLKSFVGYARRQAAKYGVKGSRLNAAKEFNIALLISRSADIKLRDIWDGLPVNDHARFIEDTSNGLRQYQICGKTLQESISIPHACDIMKKFINTYGKRAEQAAKNEGIDWKAMSHALRAAYQVKRILLKGEITYPLENADFLRDVKEGKLDFITVVLPTLESVMADVEQLSEGSMLPQKVDRKFWGEFIVNSVARVVR